MDVVEIPVLSVVVAMQASQEHRYRSNASPNTTLDICIAAKCFVVDIFVNFSLIMKY
jgi:hypothetical protein